MKLKKRIVVLITLAFIIFSSSFFNGGFLTKLLAKKNLDFREENNSKLKSADSWDPFPFIIDDTGGGDYTWLEAVLELWCIGSGTFNDPYIIENVTINGGNSETCLEIRNSNVYFIIKNCSFYNSGWNDAGIRLYYVNNGKLINNNCSDNAHYGIFLSEFCDNNTISGNIVNNNREGIWLNNECNDNILLENNMSNNDHGILLEGNCNNNIVSGNNASNNDNGIILYDSNLNNISGNTVNNNLRDGVAFNGGSENIITENIANNNGFAGIYLFVSNNNTISRNTANNNTEHGIHLDESSSNNTVSNNIMKGCGLFLRGTYPVISSNIIEKSNLVNGKTVYFYVNETGLYNDNFTDPGQIILIGCNNSIISNFNIFNTSTSIALHYGNNNTVLDNIVYNNTIHGIYLNHCNNTTISGNNASNNMYGISLLECFFNNVTKNVANNNTNTPFFLYSNPSGIYLLECDNNSVSRNNASFNDNGIHIEDSNYNNISGNNASFNDNGIYLEDSNYNNISGNNASFNAEIGIYLKRSNNNSVSKNTATNNFNGICLIDSNYNNILNNTLDYNTVQAEFDIAQPESDYYSTGNGILLKNSNYNNLSLNKAKYNGYAGIYLDDVANVKISQNQMIYCGLYISTEMGDVPPFYEIDSSNFVNNKLLYYYWNEKGLNSNNFTGAGQVLLVNCNNSIISNINISHATTGIMLWNCSNNIIFNNTVSFNFVGGIMLNSYSYNNSISRNNVTTCDQEGIGIYYSNNNNISHCLVEGGIFGISITACDNTVILNNTANNNFLAGISVYSNHIKNTLIKGNSINKSGLVLISYTVDENSFIIDDSNSVNGKKFYYYYNKINLIPSDFTNPGQIYLINCNNSLISELDISYAGIGIFLQNCNNVSVNSVNSTYNNYMGIILQNCLNCYCSQNILNNNYYGLYTISVNNTIVSFNECNNNSVGFVIGSSNRLTVFNNSFNYNTEKYNPMGSETGGYGLELFGDQNNKIIGNTIKGNERSGITFNDDCYNNTVLNNTISFNIEYGIFIEPFSNNNNSFFINNFINNGINAEDNGINNRWDDGYAGNYWGDYPYADAADDGIGDTPYLIKGTAKVFDPFPLMYLTYEDTDGEGLFNYEEYTLGVDGYRTIVTNNDTDFDDLSDYEESLSLTDPWNNDTDFDRMPDGWEVFNLLDPLYGGDNITDSDTDLLLNLYEYGNGTDPQNNDTDGDDFFDGTEVKKGTDPLIDYWYPMPNLAIVTFDVASAEVGKPFTLTINITNNGIWVAENVNIIIWVEILERAIYNNTIADLEEGDYYDPLIQILEVWEGGDLKMELYLDPEDLINETYSLEDGSLRENSEADNYDRTTLTVTGDDASDGGIEPIMIIIIIFATIAIAGTISSYVMLRPRIKKRAILKQQIITAKTDIKNFEINVRSFIRTKLKDVYESTWWEAGIPDYIKESIGMKIKTLKPKKPETPIDRMDLLDFTHYSSIITYKDNWEQTFSKIFPERNVIETNFENLRVIKSDLNEGIITREQLSNYLLYIHAIRNYFTKGFNVFLSYSTLDSEYFHVKEIAKRLESYPIIDRVFLWEEDSGENIVSYMERSLTITKVFVFFCSENAIRSKAVEDEWQAAFQMRKRGLMKVVPVYENEDLIPFMLSPLLNVKFTKDDFDGFIQKLHAEIIR